MLKTVFEVDLHHLSPHDVAFISELWCLHVVEGAGEMFVRFATEDESGVVSASEMMDLAGDEAWQSLSQIMGLVKVIGCDYVHFSNYGQVLKSVPTYKW